MVQGRKGRLQASSGVVHNDVADHTAVLDITISVDFFTELGFTGFAPWAFLEDA